MYRVVGVTFAVALFLCPFVATAVWRSDQRARPAVRQDPAVRPHQDSVALDLYNLFNSNTGTAFNAAFPVPPTTDLTFLRPTAILNPRFVRFNVTFDF